MKNAESHRNETARGVGLGLRPSHYDHVLTHRPAVPWFEIISENYMGLRDGQGGRPMEVLEAVRADYPIIMHGVSLNIGSMDPLDGAYLGRLKSLADRIQPDHVSDHLCWTGVAGENLHDLLPLPYTRQTLSHVAARVHQVQDKLKRRFLLENVSSYLAYRHSEMTEWEFLAEVASQADCGILLDINNIYVSARNHGFDPMDYLRGIPVERVRQMHLAGYSDADGFLIDTHDHPVSNPVWTLYSEALRRFGDVPTLIEWDDKIPPFSVLEQEAGSANAIRNSVLGAHQLATAR